MAAMTGPQRKNLDEPDELRVFELGQVQLATVGSQTVGRGVLQPGWRWSLHMRPTMGTTSCPVHHVQVLLSGGFAYQMDGGEVVELRAGDIADVPPGHDAWVLGDEPAVMLDIGGHIAAIAVPQEHERFVTTLLMTDIVDSTRLADRLGDHRWKQVLAEHNKVVRVELARARGVEVNTTGDGFLATFSSAVTALRCAGGIRTAVDGLGIAVRVGVHTGEVERMGADIGGIAVHVTSRIMALGGPSEVVVSSITRGLADGTDLVFGEADRREIKGLDRPVEVYRLLEA